MTPLRAVPFLVAGLFLAAPASARDYGQQGTVWSVIEPDLLEQIHARLTHLEKTGYEEWGGAKRCHRIGLPTPRMRLAQIHPIAA